MALHRFVFDDEGRRVDYRLIECNAAYERVIGLPGDRIAIANGVVMVNEHPLDEPYISAPPRYTGDWTVPADYLFVLGDNRNLSSDSHEWGMLPLDYVIGKAIFIYWPLSEMGTIAHVSLATPIP